MSKNNEEVFPYWEVRLSAFIEGAWIYRRTPGEGIWHLADDLKRDKK